MKALFFLQPGTNWRRIFIDLIAGCAQAGINAVVYDLSADWGPLPQADERGDRRAETAAFTRHVRALLEAERPDWTMAMWGNMLNLLMHRGTPDGEVATLFDDMSIPHVCYWLDAPNWAQGGTVAALLPDPIFRGSSLVHVVNNPATAIEMGRVLGFGPTHALPYGVTIPPGASAEAIEVSPEFDVVISLGPGDPAPTAEALDQLEREDPDIGIVRHAASEYAARKLRKPVDVRGQRYELRESFVDRLIQGQLQARHTPVLTRLDALPAEYATDVKVLLATPRLYIRTSMLLRSIEQAERAFTTAWLSSRFSVATFGAGDLRKLGWPSRVTPLGNIAYDAMPALYRAGKVGLNVMRWQDDCGVNLKPFEITGSGVACLTSKRSGLDGLFEVGREIEDFDSPLQAAGVLGALLGDECKRKRMAAAGQARTAQSHTWCERASRLAEVATGAMLHNPAPCA